jgi:hypothetical protein
VPAWDCRGAFAVLGCLLVTCASGCSSPPRRDATPEPPPSGAHFSYQLGGPYDPPAGVGIVGRDRTARAVPGLYSICYVNAFQAQPDAIDWWVREHPDLLLRNDGRMVIDEQWAEPLLDTSDPARLMDVIGPWIDGCARDGFKAVEADNLDSFTRSQGLLDVDDALRFARLLSDRAHANGMAIGQKNAAELSADARRAGFDFAMAEECQVYDECDEYIDVYGDGLVEIEYGDDDFQAACSARGERISIVRRDRNLVPAGGAGHVEEFC